MAYKNEKEKYVLKLWNIDFDLLGFAKTNTYVIFDKKKGKNSNKSSNQARRNVIDHMDLF